MNPCFESLKKIRLIPVVEIEDVAHAKPLEAETSLMAKGIFGHTAAESSVRAGSKKN